MTPEDEEFNRIEMESRIKQEYVRYTQNKITIDGETLKRMITEAVAKEREACAEICKKHADIYAALEQTPSFQAAWAACIDTRDAIRGRGQQ